MKTRCLNLKLSTEEYTKLRSAAEMLNTSMDGLVKSMVAVYVDEVQHIERMNQKGGI